MATLQDLVTSGLQGSLVSDADRAAYQDRLMAAMRAELERKFGNTTQNILENTYGRGLGLSSVSAQLAAENNRLREETLLKAQVEAETAARQAQAAALGQAAQYALGSQRQSLAERAQGAQEGQFAQALKQRAALNRQQLVGSGLAGLTGAGLQTAGNIWGPDIKKRLAGLFQEGAPTGGPGGTADVLRPEGPTTPEAVAAAAPELPSVESLGFQSPGNYSFGADTALSGGDLNLPPVSTDFSLDFSLPDWSSGALSLSDLIQPTNWWDWSSNQNWGL